MGSKVISDETLSTNGVYPFVPLGELAEIFDYMRKPVKSSERVSGQYPYYGASGITDYVEDYIFDGTYLLVAEDGDNLRTKKTPIAFIAEGKFWVNNHAHILKGKNPLDTEFICYALQCADVDSFISGSTRPKITQADLRKILVRTPPLEIRMQIAKILKSFDDKIELNNQMNKTLEAMAQALFKSWFVDFEPFGGVMPNDWREGTLGDVADITMGQSPSGSSYNEISNGTVFYQGRGEFGWRFPTQRLFTTEPKRLAQKNDILMSVRAPVGDINIAYENCCIGRGLAALRSTTNSQSFLLYLIQSLYNAFDVFNGDGTVFGSINKNSLHGIKIVIPSEEYITKFEKVISSHDKRIFENALETRALIKIRDTLLPKLINGEIHV